MCIPLHCSIGAALGVGDWTEDDLEFPFTLSELVCLEELSISALVDSGYDDTGMISTDYALPAIIQLIETAPSIKAVILNFHWNDSILVALGGLDWSPLVGVQSDITDTCPRVDLCISGHAMGISFSPSTLLDRLRMNQSLMALVERDVVILKPGWGDSF